MRKIGLLIRNVYRILVVNSNGNKVVYGDEVEASSTFDDRATDLLCKKLVAADECPVELDHALQKMLEQRVAKNGSSSYLAGNSMMEFLMPLFSFKHIELKMAAITLALVLTLGIGPVGNHNGNRNINPVFLADTLIDSSTLHIPVVYDSAMEGRD